MTGFYGADTEALRAYAERLSARAGRLTELKEQLAPLVMDDGAWQGPDAEAFRSQWQSSTSARFDDMAQELVTTSQGLVQEADDQDSTSEPEDHSLLDTILDAFTLAKGLKGIVTGAMKIWKMLKNGSALHRLQTLARKGVQVAADKMAEARTAMDKALRGMKGRIWDTVVDKLGGLQKFSRLMEKAPWLAKAGRGLLKGARVLGKFLPGLDIVMGGWQMYDAIKAGDTFHAVTGGVTALGGALIVAGTICDATGVGAVVGVPLQIVGGVLVGGALVADGLKYAWDHREQISRTARDVWNGAKDLRDNTAAVVRDTWNDVKDTVSDKAGEFLGGLRHAFGG